MINKIIDKLEQQLSEEKIIEVGYNKATFITQQEFEKKWNIFYKAVKEGLESYKKKYNTLLTMKPIPAELFKLSESDFARQYSRCAKSHLEQKSWYNHRSYDYQEELKSNVENKFVNIYRHLKKYLFAESTCKSISEEYDIDISPNTFLYNEQEYLDKNAFLKKDNHCIFRSYYHHEYLSDSITKDFIDTMAAIKKGIKEKLEPYWNLEATTKKYLEKEPSLKKLSPFAKWKINIGERTYSSDRYDRISANIKVWHNSKTYNYTQRNNAKEIEGIYAKIFLLDKKNVTVLVVGESKLYERTIYNIYRQIQRTDVVNDNQLQVSMHRHFDPELLYLDDYDEALEFQDTIEQSRLYRRQKQY